jgi:D-3-phosphoglycerate dehydrogenase
MKILITDKICPKAIDILVDEDGISHEEKIGLTEEELADCIEPFDALVIRSSVKITKEVMEKAPNLKIIGRAGVGVDNVDIEAATKKGVYVVNTPQGNTNAAAEHTIAMILALSRHIHEAHHSLKRDKKWDRKSYVGLEVRGKKLGVIGFGNIGRVVSEIASRGLKMDVQVFDPFAKEEDIKSLGAKKIEFDDLIKTSDYITVHVPLIPQTKGLISRKEFEMMKNGVKIINVARGGIINETDLYDFMKNGKVSGAAIDVWEEEPATENKLLELPGLLATPHLGASTIEAQENVAVEVVEIVLRALKKGEYENVVNKELLK